VHYDQLQSIYSISINEKKTKMTAWGSFLFLFLQKQNNINT